MIDEYVVNFEEYAGLGSGSIGYLGGSAYANTFDIAEYTRRVNQGALPVAGRKDFTIKERLRYDLLMKLFGLSLDLDALDRKHGVRSLKYLWQDILFFSAVGGLKKEGRILHLTPRGQYYWVIMMREFFISVNNLRDQARGALSGDERQLLFGDGASSCEAHPIAGAEADTETAESTPLAGGR